jgi:ferritin
MKPKSLNAKIVSLLTPLISEEYKHFYNYKASANWCRGVGFMKAAEAYENEALEEAEHSARLQAFLTDWNVTFELPVIEPPDEVKSLVQTIESAYAREYQLYEKYEDVSCKMCEMDTCVFDFLQQFRKIQMDTVAEYSDKLNLLQDVEDTKFNLLLLEDKLFS